MKQDLNNHCKYFKANRFQGMIKKFRDLMIKYITFAPPLVFNKIIWPSLAYFSYFFRLPYCINLFQ